MKTLLLVSLVVLTTAVPALADLVVFHCGDKSGAIGLEISRHETVGAPYGERAYAYTMEISNPALVKSLEESKALPPSAVKGEIVSIRSVSPTNTGYGVNMGPYSGSSGANLILGVTDSGNLEVDEFRFTDDDPIPNAFKKAGWSFDHCGVVTQ
jgi:hypothetical protein